MTCDFTSFSTVFQSYQDDGRMIMKGCVEWIPVYSSEDFNSSGLELGTALFLGVLLLKLYRATETNGKLIVLGVPILKHNRV